MGDPHQGHPRDRALPGLATWFLPRGLATSGNRRPGQDLKCIWKMDITLSSSIQLGTNCQERCSRILSALPQKSLSTRPARLITIPARGHPHPAPP